MRCAWVALIIKSIAAIICWVDNAAFIENVGRCKKILLFVCLCCCEFQRINNFFCCHGLSLSFLLFHPGKPVIIGDKPRRGGGGPCRLVGVADRPFLFWFNGRFRQTCRRRLSGVRPSYSLLCCVYIGNSFQPSPRLNSSGAVPAFPWERRGR